MEPTDTEVACFEAGIKFGSLYHQFVGTPVSPSTVPSLEQAIEEAIENQPYCREVEVSIDAERLELSHGYAELTGQVMTVELTVSYDEIEVQATMATEDGYPLMQIDSVRE